MYMIHAHILKFDAVQHTVNVCCLLDEIFWRMRQNQRTFRRGFALMVGAYFCILHQCICRVKADYMW